VISCLVANWGITVVLGLLFSLSEYLGQNKKIKANTVYQFIRNILLVLSKNKETSN
jgi:hypothetical protein